MLQVALMYQLSLVPSKTKHFMYKAVNNLLLCRENLAKKGIQVQEECILCAQEIDKTQDRLFLRCGWTRAAWFSYPMGFRTDLIQSDFREWISGLCKDLF